MAAFAIVTEDGSAGIYGMNRTPGPYRSENGDLVGILLICHLLNQEYSLQIGSLVMGCGHRKTRTVDTRQELEQCIIDRN
jgi:hypothetical protein